MSNGDLIDAPVTDERSVGTALATTRQAQEVQAAMIVAKRYPRDEDLATARIMKACKRKSLAEVACYEYARGNSKITGPSIRLAEVLAQNWGNVDFGFVELERTVGHDGVGVSTVQCHAWDMETNTRRAVTFTVRHWRDTKQGGYAISDERDIYEMIANSAARRVRACILAIIPGDIQDAAVEQCDKTLAGQSTEPITDRIRKMLVAFDEIGITKQQIEMKLGHATNCITQIELARLIKVFTSIRDGFGTREDHFPVVEASRPSGKGLDEVTDQIKGKSTADSEATSSDLPDTSYEASGDDEPQDDWATATTALRSAESIRDAQSVIDYWSGKFSPAKNTEFLQLGESRLESIRSSRGSRGNKQKELMDS